MSARRTFKEMVDSWKLYAQGENDIYLKNREHLEAYYKKWRKNKSRQEKIKEVSANELIKAMEYTPTSMYANSLAAPQALSGQPESQRLTRRNDEEQHGAIMPDGNESVAPNTENEGGTDQAPAGHVREAECPKRRKIRACRVGGFTAPILFWISCKLHLLHKILWKFLLPPSTWLHMDFGINLERI